MSQSSTYTGTSDYIAAPDLMQTVNVAVQLSRPLLIKGEPGTGKTMLAQSIARGLDMPLIVWNVKSTTKAQDGLYLYDTVQRLYDGQFGDRDVSDIAQYIKPGKLGEAFKSEERVVLLIDEIDKADLEFPNDLLWELDQMEFGIPEPTRLGMISYAVFCLKKKKTCSSSCRSGASAAQWRSGASRARRSSGPAGRR